ncbi:response regulator [Solitalea koreensis]|uniref:cAMP-binding domain of CRP or a regulatory subunit of cAMP-dependent protein kinases n=1 Tax=Solitalea koreensis TaxID=543615 RepID=A0A521D2Z2_9SPHI|nr:response regulator [Solitalea koreensis]SMO66012.1 cAMP-binding domain of CRP or a regulatory subunit of cAMP-dependent protein kinases [Solitalea koreensis]
MTKVLLIEDHKEVRENTAEILELSNYTVLTADNGKTGVEIALKELPDLIICDIMMPILDGYGVLHLLGKNKETASIPFIFLTAKSEKGDFRKGMELGADDYLTKPFDDLDLLKAVETRLKKSDVLKHNFTLYANGINNFIHQAKAEGKIKLTANKQDLFSYKKKQLLYSEGHKPHAVYLVVEGKVKTYKINEAGKELIISIYGPGDFIGYTAILEEINYSNNAEILEDAKLMQISKQDFMQLIHTDAQVAQQFIKLLTHNVLEKEEKLLALAYTSLRKRVANGLLQIADKFKEFENDKPKIELSRENLAHVIGTATESLIRTLSDFKSEKLIDIKDGNIIILDKKKLKHLLF